MLNLHALHANRQPLLAYISCAVHVLTMGLLLLHSWWRDLQQHVHQ